MSSASDRELAEATAEMYRALARFFEADPTPAQANYFLSGVLNNITPVVAHARLIISGQEPPTNAKH